MGLKCSLQIGEKIEGKAGPAFERQKCPCESVCDFCCFPVFSSAAFFFFFNLFLLLLRCYGFQFFYFIFILIFNFLKTLM